MGLIKNRLDEMYKKYFENSDYELGKTLFDQSKMSSQDYELSQKLMNYYNQQNTLSDQYNYTNATIEQERQKALQENSIAKDKAMKYLPEYQKLQGMGGLGVSESSVLKAQNNYNNARNTINTNANSQQAELLKNYNANVSSLEQGYNNDEAGIVDKYLTLEREEKEKQEQLEREEKAKQEELDRIAQEQKRTDQDNLAYEFNISLESGEYMSAEDIKSAYEKIKPNLREDQIASLDSKVNYYVQMKEQEEKQKQETEQAELDEQITSGQKPVEYNGSLYVIKEKLSSNANEIKRNNDFKDQIKKLGYSSAYDSKIPNGTTLTIKADNKGANDFNFWDDIGAFLFSPFGHGAYDSWGNTNTVYLTYYNGEWYKSDKK